MGVLLQAFYWDCPREAGVERGWWRHVSARLDGLRAAGFTALWLPPCSKAFSTTSMGYDPFDYFDLGEFDQRGGVETWFGSKADLVSLVDGAHAARDAGLRRRGLQPHERRRAGVQPRLPPRRVDAVPPASGRYEFDYACFHPSRFNRHDGESWGGMPDLCHRNPLVYEALMAHANMLITQIGFDGFRFDFVKGFGAWMIRSIHERQYVRGQRLVFPFGVGESWSADGEIDAWLDEINRFTDNPISAFDFPLRYRLKEMCDSYGYSLRRLAEGGTVVGERPDRAVTFVDNHDFRGGDAPPDHQ